METVANKWAVVSASVRGASHDRRGLPNQDATAHRLIGPGLTGVVAAVADGHGGSRYVRSDRGSALAVDVAGEVVAEFVDGHGPGQDLAVAVRERLIPVLVDRWRTRVLADLDADPLNDREREKIGDGDGDNVYLSYGATLLIAAAWADVVLLLQLGDGDVVAVSSSGDVQRPIPDDARLVAGETTSLGLPDAIESFRLAQLTTSAVPEVELLMLCTDGYGNSFADPDWRNDVGTDLLGRARRDGLEVLGRALPAWLAESASAGGDDVTMALLHRPVESIDTPVSTPSTTSNDGETDATAKHAAVPPPPQVAVAHPPAEDGSRGKSAGRGLLLAILAVALLAVGGLVGYAARGNGDGSQGEVAVDVDVGTEPTSTATEPSTSVTSAVPTLPSANPSLVLTRQGVVRFEPTNPQEATFTREQVLNRPTSLQAGEYVWAISSGRLSVSQLNGVVIKRQDFVAGFVPDGLSKAGDRVWLASADGRQLAWCDLEANCILAPIDVGEGSSLGR